MKLANLFIAAHYDGKKNRAVSVAYLTEHDGTGIGTVRMDRRSGNVVDGGITAGFAAFETGCIMARMAGKSKILLHAPESVDDCIAVRIREDESMPVDGDGGADYFGMGVYVYRPGDGAVKSAWQEGALAKARAALWCLEPEK